MYSDPELDTGLTQRQLAKAIITTRDLAETFIQRYIARYKANRKEAVRWLTKWNIDINNLPEKLTRSACGRLPKHVKKIMPAPARVKKLMRRSGNILARNTPSPHRLG